MKSTRIQYAKITRPDISGVIKRNRLFNLLGEKLKRPVVWISSPAGSGKTKLVDGYLEAHGHRCIWYQCDEGDADPGTFFHYMAQAARNAAPRRRTVLPQLKPEYFHNIPAFARRHFEQLCSLLLSRTQQEFFIVLDNYQDVPDEESFHNMIACMLEAVPAGIHIVVISRNDPPVAFARLRTNEKMEIIRHGDLRFTLEESSQLVDKRALNLTPEEIKYVHEKTEGWVSGIVLMLERARLEGSQALLNEDVADGGIFDYFAGQLFKKAEKGIQGFLLKTAFLPNLNGAEAERLTGDRQALMILANLSRRNFFTEKLSGDGQNYRYHPLFRDYLVKQAKAFFTPGELSTLRKQAAQIEEESGNIEDAARLYGDAGEVHALARMIAHQAREFLLQGRSKTVESWIACLPAKMVDDNPWLLYWKGMCSFPVDMPQARRYLEKAFLLFKTRNDATGAYLSWAYIVDTCAFGLDEWSRLDDYIAFFDDLRKDFPSYPSREIELIVSSRMLIFALKKTDQPEWVNIWYERVSSLLREQPSIDIQIYTAFCMSLYYLWIGEYHKNTLLLEWADAAIPHRRLSPLAVIRIKVMKCNHYWLTAQYDAALQTLSEGLDVSNRNGVHVFDSMLLGFRAAVEMISGKLEQAEKSLRNQMISSLATGRALDIFFSHVNSAWHAVLTGNASLAAEKLETISDTVAKMGIPYYEALWNICIAQVPFLQGRPGDALAHVNKAHRIGLSMKSTVIEWYSLLIGAWLLLREGEEEKGLLSLRRGFALGKRHVYIHQTFYQPAIMRFLCAKAIEQGIEEDYCRFLIQKLGLTPPVGAMPGSPGKISDLNNWPYPVRICTLGRFALFQEEEQIQATGKMQKKPLEMLKALIAAGGANVSAARLAEGLWPDTDGDLARTSFEVTLSRLRRLFAQDIILSSAGQLSINQGYCRVDSLVLAGIIEQAAKAPPERIFGLCDQAIGLYHGHFLPDDTALAWSVHRRENLKNGLLRIVLQAGRHAEQAGDWEKALGYYEKGLDIDLLSEEFYQHLMICYRKLGRTAAAVKTYHRCSEIFHKHLGIKPSARTKAIYSSLLE